MDPQSRRGNADKQGKKRIQANESVILILLPALSPAEGLTSPSAEAFREPQQRVEIDTFFTCTAKLL